MIHLISPISDIVPSKPLATPFHQHHHHFQHLTIIFSAPLLHFFSKQMNGWITFKLLLLSFPRTIFYFISMSFPFTPTPTPQPPIHQRFMTCAVVGIDIYTFTQYRFHFGWLDSSEVIPFWLQCIKEIHISAAIFSRVFVATLISPSTFVDFSHQLHLKDI